MKGQDELIKDIRNEIDKEHKKRNKKAKGYTGRVLRNTKDESWHIILIALFGAMILDFLKLIKHTVLVLIILGLIGGTIGCFFIWDKVKPYYLEYNEFASNAIENCDYSTFRPEETTFIYDSDKSVLVKLKGSQDSAYLEFDKIPNYAIDAFVAVEDRSFWGNPGIDIKGLIRVGIDAVRTKGEEIHGASTITTSKKFGKN